MDQTNIIVVGASAGGFEALKVLVAGLPADLPASIFIVWHMSPDVRSILPQLLSQIGTMPAAHAVDLQRIETGRIYIAPPDRHLILEDGHMRVTRGPKENRFRPAVDPLFRSAAYHYGADVIGIILSGALDDGTSGLWTVKQRGGTAIVQDPRDAEVPSMPENAIREVAVDYTVAMAQMPRLLVALVNEKTVKSRAQPTRPLDKLQSRQLELEIGIAAERTALESGIMDFGELSPYACPDCHGVLSALKDGHMTRFRCHTGHAFTNDTLLRTLTENIEHSIWSAIRGIEESIILLNHMGDHFAEVNQPPLAGLYFRKANEAKTRNQLLREAVLTHEQLSGDSLRQENEITGVTGEDRLDQEMSARADH